LVNKYPEFLNAWILAITVNYVLLVYGEAE